MQIAECHRRRFGKTIGRLIQQSPQRGRRVIQRGQSADCPGCCGCRGIILAQVGATGKTAGFTQGLFLPVIPG
jgi:hypothetical protein